MNLNKNLFIAFSILIGIVFLASGIGKAMDTKSFAIIVSNYGFTRLSVFSPLVILFEIALGLAFILNIRVKEISFLAIICLAVFTGLYSYAYLIKGITDCGCFGALTKPISPLLFYLKNVVLLLLSLVLYLSKNKDKETGKLQRNLFFTLLLIGTYLTGFSYNNPIKENKPVEPVFLKNQNVNDTKLQKLINTHKDSTYMVFMYSYKCPYCIKSLKKINEYQKTETFDRLILIGGGSDSDKNAFYKEQHITGNHIDISKAEMKRIINYYPRTFFVKNNTIVDELVGELPDVKDLKIEKILKSLN